MIPYQVYEKAVYDWLLNKRELDPNFTFSTRIKGSKGSELDYFIGTEKSGYFGFTLWNIPVSFPGSAGDVIDIFCGYTQHGISYYIQFVQTESPKDLQNELVLKFLKSLKPRIDELGSYKYESKPGNSMFKYELQSPKENYTSIDDLLADLNDTINQLTPIIDEEISRFKATHPEFQAHRITNDEFDKYFIENVNRRQEKYENIGFYEDIEIDFKHFLEKFEKQDLDLYLDFLREIGQYFGLETGDERLVFNVHSRRGHLSFTIGQRYCLTLRKKQSDGDFGFISTKALSNESEQFKGSNPRPWFTYQHGVYISKEMKESIFDAIKFELERSEKSGYRKFNKPEFEELILGKQIGLSQNGNQKSMNNTPLNQILYGPPGTGKTFNTIDTAISIVNPEFDLKQERKEILEEYYRLVKTGSVVFTTFHQSMSYEDFIEGIKPLKSDSGDSVIYDVEAGLFKIACANAGYFCYQKSLENDKKQHKYTFDDLYDSFIEYYQEFLETGTEFSFKTLTGKEVTIIHINSNDSIQARALHSTATKKPAPLTKENLQKLYDRFSSVEEILSLSQVQETVEVTPRITEFYAVFKGLKDYEKTIFKPEDIESIAQIEALDEQVKLKKFDAGVFKEAIKANSQNAEKVVMIIDEINRGNISAIFGELITLIEESKRLGKHEFLEITLPYSKKKFSVPANLYIIGTMNTADRSVESLDTALRRRFSFKEMLPNPSLLKDKGENGTGKIGDFDLEELLITINDRIEALVDRDHTIGHAFFMDVYSLESLRIVFANKVIPLLQEYFYGDYAKMEMVIGPDFFNIDKRKKKVTFAVQNEDVDIPTGNYELMNILDPTFNFVSAINRLLNRKVTEVEVN
jgi:5-methylcytosine-specific restriction protein B